MYGFEVDCRSVLPELSQSPPWLNETGCYRVHQEHRYDGCSSAILQGLDNPWTLRLSHSVNSLYGASTMASRYSACFLHSSNHSQISTELMHSAHIYASACQRLQLIDGVNKSNGHRRGKLNDSSGGRRDSTPETHESVTRQGV